MGLGEVVFFLGWVVSQGVVSWVAWEGKVWLFFKVGRRGFFFVF